MTHYQLQVERDTGHEFVSVSLRGHALMHHPLYNKGTAFPQEEREQLGLLGLLPPQVATMEEQLARTYANYQRKGDDLDKHLYLNALQDRNEVLFFRLLLEHLEEMMPIVYTPTVGEFCQKYSRLYRRPRGVYITPHDRDRIDDILSHARFEDIDIIVATDNEGILGLGDLGVGGMGIPIGKLALYVAGAGIHPAACLPVDFDVGTNNEELLQDPLYLGIRQSRLRGEEYFQFLDRFVESVQHHFPRAVLQWEDFSRQNSFSVLERYRDRLCSFNDDIQGTGAVAMAGIMGALRLTGGRMRDNRFVFLGAGAGGVGVARQLRAALIADGLTKAEATERFFLVDSKGLILDDRPRLEEYKKEWAQPRSRVSGWEVAQPDRISLLETVKHTQPTGLLGLSTIPGAFTEEIVRTMAQSVERPIVFTMSNPNTKCEAQPVDVLRWTDGRAIVATGSPFPDVHLNGQTYRIGQGNNAFIFPGVGLGAVVSRTRIITDEMFTAAARALAAQLTPEMMKLGCVYPPQGELRSASAAVALAVALEASRSGHAQDPGDEEELRRRINKKMWEPRYLPYRPV